MLAVGGGGGKLEGPAPVPMSFRWLRARSLRASDEKPGPDSSRVSSSTLDSDLRLNPGDRGSPAPAAGHSSCSYTLRA